MAAVENLDFADIVDLDDVLLGKCTYVDLDECPRNNDSGTIKVGHLNIHGLISKHDDLVDLLDTLNDKNLLPDVLLLCETFLNQHNFDNITFPHYDIISEYRKNKSKGGVSIMIRDTLRYQKRDDLKIFDEGVFESLFIELPRKSECNIVIGEVYRVPGTNEKQFLEYYETIVSKVRQEKKKIIIGTDQNLDYLKINRHTPTMKFFDLNMSNNMIPSILKPTRVTHNTATLIDNIYVDAGLCCTTKSHVVITDISDHFFCLTIIQGELLDEQHSTIKRRKLTESVLRNIKGALMNIDWNYMHELSVDAASNSLHEEIIKVLDFYAPEKIITLTSKYKKREPWFTEGLKVSSIRCRKLFRKVHRLRHDSVEYVNYRVYRNMYQKLRRQAKYKHIHQIMFQNKKDIKKLWEILNNITGKVRNKKEISDELYINGIKQNDRQIIGDAFARYFSEIGKNMADKIDQKGSLHGNATITYQRVNSSCFFYPTTCAEIEMYIKKLKSKNTLGFDQLSNKILKAIYPGIINALYIIFNRSLVEGIFPSNMKQAIIKPIYKAKSVFDLCNYRPISILPVMSKILEKIVHFRLTKFFDKHGVLYEGQYGFRKFRSTNDAILDLTGNILDGFNKKMFTVALFLDMTKAFDSIKHSTLLKKMEHYGVRGLALNWIESYLTDRNIRVLFRNLFSKSFNVNYGTPQGSVLGPLFYSILANDMPKCLRFCNSVMFADDTTIYLSGKNLKFMYKKITEDLNHLMKWFDENTLSLNVDKSCYILFSNHNSKVECSGKLIADGKEITRVKYTKFLGVYVDEHLDWNEHVQHLLLKMSSGIYSLNMSKNLLSTASKKILYYANIQSHLTYAISAWGPMITMRNFKKIQVQQNKAIRSLFVLNRRTRLQPYFKTAKILNMSNLLELELAKISYKYVNNLLPKRIANLFESPSHDYHTRQRTFPQVQQHTLQIYNRSFLGRAPGIFLRLPDYIRCVTNIKLFSKRLVMYKLL